MHQSTPKKMGDVFKKRQVEDHFNNPTSRNQMYRERQYNYLMEYLTGVYLNRFTIDNAPESLNTFLIEQSFLTGCQAVAVGMYEGDLRVIGTISQSTSAQPTLQPTMTNGLFSLSTHPDPFIPARDMKKMTQIDPNTGKGDYTIITNKDSAIYGTGALTDLDIIKMYADELADIKLASFTNMNAMKTSMAIMGKKGQIDKAMVVDQLLDSTELIAVNDDLDMNDIQVLQPSVQNYQDVFQKKYNNVMSEILMFFGVNTNPETEKKERMIKGEVEANNGVTTLASNVFLNPRKRAIEILNNAFELDLNVRYAYDNATDITGTNAERETPTEVE